MVLMEQHPPHRFKFNRGVSHGEALPVPVLRFRLSEARAQSPEEFGEP